ncbi:MAG: PKD domain-containing protein [Telluria sp.]|nr:peptidoglycan DD-metalloendopeptidase family protein [Telluria sp.]
MLNYRNRIHAIMLVSAMLLTACHRGTDNQAPTAVFAASQPSAEQVTTYAFSSAGSTDKDGTIASFAWDFGDGTSSTVSSPVHVYGTSGSYLVKLTVTDNNGAIASATRSVDIKTPAVSAAVETAAVTITLPQVASVQVPEAAFPSPTHLGVWATSNPVTAADFDLTAQMFSASLRATQEIRVNTGKVKPSKTLKVIANLPAELEARLQAKDEPKVFIQIFQAGGEEVLDSFELVPAVYDASKKVLQFDLDPNMLTDRRSLDETWEAVIVVGSTPTKPSSPTAPKAPPHALKEFAGTETARPWPPLAIAGQVNFSAPRDLVLLAATATAAACAGATLRPPLADLTVTGEFNPPTHFGTDYRAADGTDVQSMADGTVSKIGFDSRPLPRPDPRSGKMVKGWGNYVVITHNDGSKSLYAHLQTGDIKVSAGESVTAGETIALSDNSGGSQASHLHVEYAPNGEIFSKGSKIDPNACIGNNVNGAVQVSDNGTLADDAFSVSVNGKQICVTAIGASNSCAIGALRSGNATLSITATIAPDDVGTYQIALSGGITFLDGSSTVSGTMGQGATVSFVIAIP